MIYKVRTASTLLKILRSLNIRGELTEDERKYYSSQEKGYAGEVAFDLLTEKFVNDCFVLNDLLLEINNNEFQIDTLIIYQNTIYLFDVKHHEGDYVYEKDLFRGTSGWVFKNPLDQLHRCKALLYQLLQHYGYHLKIEAYVIFNHPEFTLYQAPQDQPFILPTQINRFMKKLDSKPSRLNSLHKKLAEKLVSLHKVDSSYTKVPKYEYGRLRKGQTCFKCDSFSVSVDGQFVVCGDCGCTESVESAILRCVDEVKLLFPDMKITTTLIHEWCQVVGSKKRISRVLKKYYTIKGYGQWSYFE